MKRFTPIIIVFLLLSCRDILENTPVSFESLPVLNSLIEAGKPVFAHASLTSAMGASKLTGLNDAIVELFVDDEFEELLKPAEGGWFVSPFVAQPGKLYSLRLQVPGYEMVTARSSVPQSFALLDIQHIAIAGKEEHGETYPAVYFTFENSPEDELFNYWSDDLESSDQ